MSPDRQLIDPQGAFITKKQEARLDLFGEIAKPIGTGEPECPWERRVSVAELELLADKTRKRFQALNPTVRVAGILVEPAEKEGQIEAVHFVLEEGKRKWAVNGDTAVLLVEKKIYSDNLLAIGPNDIGWRAEWGGQAGTVYYSASLPKKGDVYGRPYFINISDMSRLVPLSQLKEAVVYLKDNSVLE